MKTIIVVLAASLFMGSVVVAEAGTPSRAEMVERMMQPISNFPMIAQNPQLDRQDYREYATCLIDEANEYVDSGTRMRYMDGSRLSLSDYYDLVYTYLSSYRHPTWGMTEIQVRDVYLNIYAYCNKHVTTSGVELRRLNVQAERYRMMFDFEER